MATILLAEDDNDVRELLTCALKRDGHEVTAVENGELAVEELAVCGFDMLLSDITMPKLDGIALARKVTVNYPKTPILLMTGHSGDRRRARNLGVLIHDVIIKPFTLLEIRDAISRTLAGAA